MYKINKKKRKRLKKWLKKNYKNIIISFFVVLIPTIFNYKDIYNYLFVSDVAVDFDKGLNYFKTDQLEKAYFHFEKAFNEDPEYPTLAYHYGRLLHKKKDFHKAIFAFENIKNPGIHYEHLDFYKADSYKNLQKTKQALYHFNREKQNLVSKPDKLYWQSLGNIIILESNNNSVQFSKKLEKI